MLLSTLLMLNVVLTQDEVPVDAAATAAPSASTFKAGAATFGIAWGLNEVFTLAVSGSLIFGSQEYSGPQLGVFLLLANSVPVFGPLATGILFLYLDSIGLGANHVTSIIGWGLIADAAAQAVGIITMIVGRTRAPLAWSPTPTTHVQLSPGAPGAVAGAMLSGQF